MIDDIETQWKKWQDENPASSFMDINDGELKEKTISDLCSECYIKISEAQRKTIEEIKKLNN